MEFLEHTFNVSQRRACECLGVARSTVRDTSTKPERDRQLVADLHKLKREHTEWGYRKMRRRLVETGWHVSVNKVYRIWREHGWQCTRSTSRKKKAAGQTQNACHIRQATQGNQVWSIDFVKDHTMDGKALKNLTVLDEYTREAVAIEIRRTMGQQDVRDILVKLFEERGVPAFIRSDNGGKFAGQLIGEAMKSCGSEVALIAPGSPWQNGKNERFNGILSQEVLSKEIWGNVREAQVVCNQWKQVYNEVRPHGSLGMMTPACYAQHALGSGQWHHQSLDQALAI